jgi:hypothetical protein
MRVVIHIYTVCAVYSVSEADFVRRNSVFRTRFLCCVFILCNISPYKEPSSGKCYLILQDNYYYLETQ